VELPWRWGVLDHDRDLLQGLAVRRGDGGDGAIDQALERSRPLGGPGGAAW
jgi:hypothetical protein